MAPTYSTAPDAAVDLRLHAVHVVSATVNFNDTGIASAFVVAKVPANSIIIGGNCVVRTAFNAGTTNVLTFGTSATATELWGAGDITEGTPGPYVLPAASVQLVTSDTSIYAKYTQTGTAATTGKATVSLLFVPLYGGV